MSNIKSLVMAAVGCVLVAGSLSAQTAGQVKWKGVNGAWSGYSNSATGSSPWYVYTSPYRAVFNIPGNSPASPLLPRSGNGSFGPTVDIFCVDFVDAANTGTYNAWFTNLGADPLTKTRFNNSAMYLKAAYLAQQVAVVGAGSAAGGDINGAIWEIMNGSPRFRWDGTSWSDTGINSWIALATANYGSVDASNWVVVTDQLSNRTRGGSQEYLTQVQVTPEPATMLLLGTGLLVMMLGAGLVKRLSA